MCGQRLYDESSQITRLESLSFALMSEKNNRVLKMTEGPFLPNEMVPNRPMFLALNVHTFL